MSWIRGNIVEDVFNYATATSMVSLWGGNGDDTMTGGAAADRLVGGQGADVLTGGAGGDLFMWGQALDSMINRQGVPQPPAADSHLDGVDTITDFEVGSDHIMLIYLDANTSVGGYQRFGFAGENTEAVANSVTWFHDGQGNTIVQADVNGDTTADLQIRLVGELQLSAGDFVL